MDKVRKLWFAFIAGNIYDVVLSFIAWHYHFIELNPIVSSFANNGYFWMLEVLIGLKLIVVSVIYLILSEVKDKVLILTTAVIGTMFIVTWDMLNFFALYKT